jgi:hypothetical protein
LKHLQHTSKTLIKTPENTWKRPLQNICNICVKHVQHSDKHTCNIRLEKQLKRWEQNLQQTCTTIATYATSQSTFETSIWSTCNIQMKHLKHSKYTFCNMRFQHSVSLCCLEESQSSTSPRRMELADVPLGEDRLGGLGKHLHEAREHSPWTSTCSVA